MMKSIWERMWGQTKIADNVTNVCVIMDFDTEMLHFFSMHTKGKGSFRVSSSVICFLPHYFKQSAF